MTKESAFWDSSALVPLCVHEVNSRRARAQLHRFVPVIWWGTCVEIHSAIARQHRRGELSNSEKQKGIAQLELLSIGCKEILPGDQLRDLARRLLDAHDLRAGDSLQLAAALVWRRARTARRAFLSADQRLLESAKAEGFSIVDLS